ncbi:MAG: hypothetical protein AAF960_26015 [Bacteroidota bacterium]
MSLSIKIVTLFSLLGCMTTIGFTQNTTPIQGTWKLVKYKWGDMKNHQIPQKTIYKIYTKEHFAFVRFDENKFSGAGGGSYMVNAETFTETLAYYSEDSTATGTAQRFNYTIGGNVLHQTGFIKGTDQYDDYVIDEYYERIEAPEQTNGLVGLWQIEKATYGNSTKTADESRWTIQKCFTPSHWYVAYYDAENGGFNGAGFGTYELQGNQYFETIQTYSWDSTAIGQTVQFTMDMTPSTLVQKGFLNTAEYQDYRIEEYFKRVE